MLRCIQENLLISILDNNKENILELVEYVYEECLESVFNCRRKSDWK